MTLNAVDPSFINALTAQLGPGSVRKVSAQYTEEPRGLLTGQVGMVVAPASTEEVATVIRAAHQARVGVVPMGGGTGLVGGQVMPEGPAPLVLSLERMDKVRAIYPHENIVIAEAGVILEHLHDAAREVDRLFPLSLAAGGSCRIGGNLSTNAGGVNVLRYGNTRDLCLGLEAVLPDGSIWHGLKRLRKDNTGYDLRNLLIGAEGTLGVITAAALRLFPRPSARMAAIMVVPGPSQALELLSLAGGLAGNDISMFELIGRSGPEFLAETMPQVRLPFETPPDWMVLMDLGTQGSVDPQTVLTDIFEAGFAAGLVTDGVVAQNEAQRLELLHMRESIPEANRHIGSIASQDISLPLGSIAEFIEKARAALQVVGDIRINCFGHLGDGNLHYNIFPSKGLKKKDYPADTPARVRRIVHDLVAEFDGSFSAEHGVGRMKVDDLERYGDPTKLSAMRAIKSALDPEGIMNPGAVLRQTD